MRTSALPTNCACVHFSTRFWSNRFTKLSSKNTPPSAHSLFLHWTRRINWTSAVREKNILLSLSPSIFSTGALLSSFKNGQNSALDVSNIRTMFETAAAVCLNRQADPVKTFMHKKLELRRISIFGRPCGPKSFIIESPAACLSLLSRRGFLTPRHAPAIAPVSRFC